MADTGRYSEEEIAQAKVFRDDNLETFKKKFLIFFIGLCSFALGIVINAFGGMVAGILFIMGGVAVWGAPLVIKYWFSGWGALFDFRYEVYEIYPDGTKKNVTTVGDMMVGPFLKCAVALLVVVVALYLVPAEIVVRFLNHRRAEKKIGEKGALMATPRREMALTALVLVAMIVVGAIGGAVSRKKEDTSDISDVQIVELLDKLEAETDSYKIGEFNNGFLREYATITEQDGNVSFVSTQTLKWVLYIDTGHSKEYTLNPGTYEYKNGAWVGVNEDTAFVLSQFTLGLALDFDAMRSDVSQIVVNQDTGLGYYYDTEQHEYYELKPKKNSTLQFEEILVEANCTFARCSGGYNYIYIFAD